MHRIKVETIKGIREEKVYSIADFPYERFSFVPVSVKQGKEPVVYLECSAAFDIETTNIKDPDRPYGYMYQWQACINESVVFGRRIEEFIEYLNRLRSALYLSDKRRLVIFVHNLAFEFQFIKDYLDIDSGFFKAERKPLKVVCSGIEFRDSYALSNMSLEKFCENTANVIHYKLTDTYDYAKIRTPATPLTEVEHAYCYNDVAGLAECITEYRKHDNLAVMPLTSTGYVRRDFRKAMRSNKKLREMFLRTRLDADLYMRSKQAFRGGDTHANVYWVGELAENVTSYDISSSYPFQMMTRRYPMGKWYKVRPEHFRRELLEGKNALLIHCAFIGVSYRGRCGNPYISIAKCLHKSNVVNDNGRVLSADFVELTLTDIDFRIIEKDYDIEQIKIESVYASYYDYLPKEFKDTLMEYFRAKTLLKGDPDHEYEYMKSKNKLNSSYGMTVTDIAKPVWRYENGQYIKEETDLRERLDKFYASRNNFLPYQWGVWVTAWARMQLREMLWTVGEDVIYCDTDSVKFSGNHAADFERKNEELRKLAEEFGAYCDRNGKRVYMGVWDHDADYKYFKTLGSKKYCFQYQDGDEIYSTIAGVSKAAGRKFFTEHGFEAFKNETVIPRSGHLVAYYNDTRPHTIEVEGCTFYTASNIALIDGDYTIGQTAEYLDLLEKALEKKKYLM